VTVSQGFAKEDGACLVEAREPGRAERQPEPGLGGRTGRGGARRGGSGRGLSRRAGNTDAGFAVADQGGY